MMNDTPEKAVVRRARPEDIPDPDSLDFGAAVIWERGMD